ncbi:MAG: metallophosphoesterase [Candidatus Magasanikbacteria bacterium]
MNFFTIIIIDIIFISALLIYFFWRDIKIKKTFLNKRKKLGYVLIAVLFFIIFCGIDAFFIEPWLIVKNEIEIKDIKISQPIKIAFISDIQIGNHKKTAWTEKMVEKINEIQPDLILLGGDLIDNEGTFEDESQYLEPLRKISDKYPIYYILGNHEYGIGSQTKEDRNKQTGDRSQLLITKMKDLKITLLRNNLECPTIKNQKICLFGLDDIWSRNINFDELKNWDKNLPLIFLTHNPDGIKIYPINQKIPDLTLAGHTHGGQIRLPFIGPLGSAQIQLPKKYYSGLNDWCGMKIFTTVGIGESGGQIRFLDPPEMAIINLKPQN